MPTFQYRAYGDHGELTTGKLVAMSENAAHAALAAKKLIAFHLKEVSEGDVPWWKREIYSPASAKRAVLAEFTRQFAELCSSGMPIDDCLRILSEQLSSGAMRENATRLLNSVLEGSSLADAMRQQKAIFPTDYQNIVRAGEMGGTLAGSLGELTALLETQVAIDARVRSALTYPAILLGLAFVSVGIIVSVLVPSIAPIFEQSGRRPPELFRIIVLLRDNSGWLVFAGAALLAIAVAAIVWIKRSPARLAAYDLYKLATPVVGTLILDRETARFARTLGTLLKAGVPLLQGVAAAGAVVENRVLSARIDRAISSVREGRSLAKSLSDEDIFPRMAIRIIAIGEETAKLDRMLIQLSLTFEQRVQRSVDRFMTLLTPALTIAIAVIVGGLIVAVMNAILSINELAAG